MINKVLTIHYPEGLRARAAAEFVQTASNFASQMLIEKGNKKVNAKSIMGVLSLAVPMGDNFHLFVSGPDEQTAMDAMVELLKPKA